MLMANGVWDGFDIGNTTQETPVQYKFAIFMTIVNTKLFVDRMIG